MDPRVRQHAEIVVNHSVEIQEGDNVILDAHPVADDLVVALHELIGDRGANPLTLRQRTGKRALRAYLNAYEGEMDAPEHEQALVDAADVYISVRADRNVTELNDVDSEAMREYRLAHKPIRDARLSTRWVLTQYPAAGNAQLANMSTAEYESFVWDAILRDWTEQRDFQAGMVDRLEAGDELRLQSGDTTDLVLGLGENPVRNDWAQRNLPGGEVFTAPVPDRVEGEVLFDLPLYYEGKEIEDAWLQFDGGEVVDHRAGRNEELLGEILDTDDGARRLGELGIGMNRGIDQFTYNMLFDEKMGDTVHLALGRAYEDTVADGAERNDSAVHVDMIVDMSDHSSITIDGEIVQRNGVFAFEDGFEG